MIGALSKYEEAIAPIGHLHSSVSVLSFSAKMLLNC